MAQGGTTTIKPTAPLQMPNEQKWAREFDNNRQADAVAGSLQSQNPNPNQDLNASAEPAEISQNLIQGVMNMDIGSIKDAVGQATEMAGQKIFAEALKQSWYNIIETYGLTLIYINFHFIMAYLAKNRYFGKFGSTLSFGGKMDAVSKVDGGLSETLTEYAEIIVLFLINGLILFVLFLIACIISFIAWAATEPTEFLRETGVGAVGQIIVDLLE